MSGACFTSQFRQSKQVCRDENIHYVGVSKYQNHQQLIGKEEKGLAQIKIKGKVINLGRYQSLTEAAIARTNAARKHFGQFT